MKNPTRIGILALTVLLTATIAACTPVATSPHAPRLHTTPHSMARTLAADDDIKLRLPRGLDAAGVVDPAWTSVPAEAGGIFLGARDDNDRIVFSAVASDGAVLWEAERPKICSAFIAAQVDDRNVAVLMNVEASSEAFSVSTASAYDLNTGREIWGPVVVPGPHRGPGLVFSAPPEDFIGSNGPSLALDPSSGEVVADERLLPGGRIIGEHSGIVLLSDQHGVHALDAAGIERWVFPLRGANRDVTLESASVGTDFVLLGSANSERVVLRMSDGKILAEEVRGALFDERSKTLIVLDQELRGIDATGTPLWRRDAPEGAVPVSAGRGLFYLRTHGGAAEYLATSGEKTAEEEAIDIPLGISPSGSAYFDSSGRILLSTIAH